MSQPISYAVTRAADSGLQAYIAGADPDLREAFEQVMTSVELVATTAPAAAPSGRDCFLAAMAAIEGIAVSNWPMPAYEIPVPIRDSV
jgi:hypothetical protein